MIRPPGSTHSPNKSCSPDTDYRAIFCTDVGAIYVDLLETQTPNTVNNFVFLAENGYYNNTTFHRVIEDFMAQGGDPTATGTGGPGYAFGDEFVSSLTFDRPGLLAMANAGPNTNGSQFFITTVPTPHLNQMHTIFGKVLSGQANVENIQLRDPATATEPGTTLQTVVIITDPSTVALPDSVPVTQDEAKTALDQVSTVITSDIADVLEYTSTTTAANDVINGISEPNRQTIGDLLQSRNYEYQLHGILNNKACDMNTVPFMSASYTLDKFTSAEDAAGALDDGVFEQLAWDKGFGDPQVSENLSEPYFKQDVTACDQPAVYALTYWQRGAFVATVEITVPSSATDVVDNIDFVLSQNMGLRLFEPFLSDILYRDIR